jgi:hypothetical protein
MPNRLRDSDGDGIVDYLPSDELNPESWDVVLDACLIPIPIERFEWTMRGKVENETDCAVTRQLAQGTYEIGLRVFNENGELAGAGSRQVVVRDRLIVSIGDALASGEGNPDRPDGWESIQCHRSTLAGPAQAAMRIERADPKSAVTFVHLACSGATIRRGVVGPYETSTGTLAPQLAQAAAMTGGRPIDALFVSVGADDVGFNGVVMDCIVLPRCWTLDKAAYDARLEDLPSRFGELAACLGQTGGACGTTKLAVPAERTFLMQYLDPTRDSGGKHCKGVPDLVAGPLPAGPSSDGLKWASEYALARLNDTGAAAAHSLGWRYVDGIAADFGTHGYCSEAPWVVEPVESLLAQNDTAGTLRPNVAGHLRYATSLSAAVLREVP